MEQTINTSTTTGTTAAPAPQGAAAVAAAAPDGTAAPDAAAQFGTLLDALQMTAALAPVTESGDDSHAGTSAKDAKADDQKDGTTTDAAATAVAASLVPAALLVPAATTPTPSLPTAGAPAGEPAGQPTATPVTGVIAPPPAAGPALPVTGAADAAQAGTASAAATAATGPATSGPATSGPDTTTGPAAVLPDGDVDPALVQAAVTAAAETAPTRPVTAGRATARTATTAADAASDDAAGTTSVAADAVTTTAAATTGAAPVTPADTPDNRGNDTATSSGNGQGGRLDLQVQPAPRLKEATPAAPIEATVASIDRDRLERLADGLAVRLRVSHAAEGARIRMQLEPRELGEVVVRLEIHNGIAHAHLIAESADAGRALSSSLSDLRSALADRGLQLESVSVRVAGEGASNTGGSQAGQSQADRRGRGPLTFGRLDPVATTAATDTADRPHEGQAVWMLA